MSVSDTQDIRYSVRGELIRLGEEYWWRGGGGKEGKGRERKEYVLLVHDSVRQSYSCCDLHAVYSSTEAAMFSLYGETCGQPVPT